MSASTRLFPLHPLALALVAGLSAAPTLHAQTVQTPVQLDAVNVHGERSDERTALAGYGDSSVLDAPVSVTVIDRGQLQDRQARVLSEVLRADASAADAYAPIGYYENFSLRGYQLNAANGYRINGLSAAGEQIVALDNKEQVQVLKGLSGLQSGVNEPAGLIDYVTKRPRHVRSLELGVDDDGGRRVAADWGDWFGTQQQFGLRVNAAYESLRPYVEHTDGHRKFVSLAADWKPGAQSLLQFDLEYQRRSQRSVPGYALLGGTAVPDVDAIDLDRLLAYQPWSRPVGMDSLNTQLRYRYRFSEDWNAELAASRSRVRINDFSAFAWGCYGVASCADDAIPNYFGRDGGYDLYDYRNPDDDRRHDQLQATLSGRFSSGPLEHQLSLGADWLRRTVDRYGSVNEWIGSGDIHGDPPVFDPTSEPLGPRHRRQDSRQKALLASDRISLGERWQLLLGARQVWLDDRAFDRDGALTRRTRSDGLLPQAALLFKPAAAWSLYASFAKSLALGGTAPWFADNADEILAPTHAYQNELGAKFELGGIRLGAALFDIRQAYQFARPQADGGFLYVQQGQLHNRGLELSADGNVSERLRVAASVTGLRARAENTGIAAYEGHQAINVPKLRASVQADYALPGIDGLALLGG
ncbi:MAG TPA: TonB-dependent siderophore receptor, partial [Xanthomonadaceae bacterium]|nr:TonB-dependent siderophore receptor [Xanthomonadaceae bacterium]